MVCWKRIILEAMGNALVYGIIFIVPNGVQHFTAIIGYSNTVTGFGTNEDIFIRGIRYIHAELRVPCWAAIAIVLDEGLIGRQGNWTFQHNMWTVLPFVQAFLFGRGFYALAYLDKNESVQAGERGLFGDLTIPDQYNIVLPLLILATCVLDYEMERYRVDVSKFGYMKYIARGIKPIIFFPIAIRCPASIQIYWTVWGIVSLSDFYYLADSNHAQNVKGPSTNQEHRLFPVAPRASEENGYYEKRLLCQDTKKWSKKLPTLGKSSKKKNSLFKNKDVPD